MDQQELRKFEQQCTQSSPPACTASCPLHVDARALMQAVKQEDFAAAADILQKKQPFPGIISRICEHPCETACTRQEAGGSLAISEIEKYCVQNIPTRPLSPKAIAPKQGKIAVVGAGISGLTAAWELAKKGYSVVIFEAASAIGGRLLTLDEKILPQQVFVDDLAVLNKSGIEIRLNSCVGIDISWAKVFEEFTAVYLACGLKGKVPDQLAGDNGHVEIDEITFCTALPNVFAGGSMRRGQDSFIYSAGDGRRATISIDRFMQKASLVASRQREGEFVTDLFVNTSGVPALPPVLMDDQEQGYSRQEAVAEASRCLDCQCLECVKACTFMQKFKGYPKTYLREIYNNDSIVMGKRHANKLINSCSLCGQCGVICPNDLDLGEVIKVVRQEMVQKNKMPPSAHDFALQDMAYSNSDLFALTKHEPGTVASRYVFFPGCQLSASNPQRVEEVYAYLRQGLDGGVGLMLRCCGAPAEWAGREDLNRQALGEIRAEWEALGKPVIITACSTCFASFKPNFPEVVSIWEIIRQIGLPESSRPGRKFAIHDTCTTRLETQMHEDVRTILAQLGYAIEELPYNRDKTKCCGYGGLMWSANRDLSKQVALERAQESDADYVVYCAMCRDSLAAQGKRTVHLLDLIFDADPLLEAEKAGPNYSTRHENRFRLKTRLTQNLWQEDLSLEKSYMNIKLKLLDGVQELLEERRILLEDVQKVIEYAEETGRKFINDTDQHFLAYYKPASVTYWVEYSPQDEYFVVHNAYCHRMQIMEDR